MIIIFPLDNINPKWQWMIPRRGGNEAHWERIAWRIFHYESKSNLLDGTKLIFNEQTQFAFARGNFSNFIPIFGFGIEGAWRWARKLRNDFWITMAFEGRERDVIECLPNRQISRKNFTAWWRPKACLLMARGERWKIKFSYLRDLFQH